MKKEITPRLLTVAETAIYTSFAKGTLYNLISSGSTEGLPCRPIIIGKGKLKPRYRFDKAKLDAWIERGGDST